MLLILSSRPTGLSHTAKHCGTSLDIQMFKMKDGFLKSADGMLGNHTEFFFDDDDDEGC